MIMVDVWIFILRLVNLLILFFDFSLLFYFCVVTLLPELEVRNFRLFGKIHFVEYLGDF